MRRGLKCFLFSILIIAFFSLSFSDIAKAQNGSLYLSPSLGKVSVGEIFSLVLRVNTGGTAINSTEGSIVFDQRELSVTSVSKSGSIFSIWASEPKFSNAEGTIEFAGGIPNPGYSGSNGLVLTINFKAKVATTVKGYTDIVLVSGSVLANDGEGTDILASLGKATYNIISAGTKPSVGETPVISQPVLPRTEITSTTHPDQEKWYSNGNPIFKWKLFEGVDAVSYLITDTSTSNPGTIPDGFVEQAQSTNIADGVNYFHLRFRENGIWGPISHFKFQIDTKIPKEFNIVVTDDNSNEPKLTFESADDLSGIDHYEIKIDKKDWIVIDKLSAGLPYRLINQGYGEHQILIKAVDMASNSITAPAVVSVSGSSLQNKFTSVIRLLFQNGLFPAVAIALVALAHEFFVHSNMWKKIKKNIKLKKNDKNNILNLRDIRNK